VRHKAIYIVAAVLVSLSLLVTAAGCAEKPAAPTTPGTTPPPAQQQIVLKLAHYWAPNFHAIVNWVEPWANEIEARSKGRVKIERYYAEALVKANDLYEATQEGITDMAFLLPMYEAGKFPIGTMFELPFAAPAPPAGMSPDEAAKVGSDVAWAFWEKYSPLELSPDVKLLNLTWGLSYPAGGYYFFTKKKAVHTLEDLKGLQIRSPGGFAPLCKLLGATPVAMTLPETYESLERGILNGTLHLYATVHSAKLYEVLDYATDIPILTSVMGQAINKKKWDSLPKDVQDTIWEVSREYNHWGTASYNKVGEETRVSMGTQAQLGVISVPQAEQDRWGEAMLPLWDEWLAGAGPRKEAAKFYLDAMTKAGFPPTKSVVNIINK